MAKIYEMSAEELNQFNTWVAQKPKVIQEMIKSHPPDRLYKISSGHRVIINSYCEDGTVTVAVLASYNKILFERNVFGIDIHTLQECDIPDPNENLGATFTEPKDIENCIQTLKENRPPVL